MGPLFSPAVSPLSLHTLWVRSSGFLSRGIIQSSISVVFTESAAVTQGLVGAAAGCLTFLFVHHALRDVLVAFHELLGGELFARVWHAPSRAARGVLD